MFALLSSCSAVCLLVWLSSIATVYLYTYPVFHACTFISPRTSTFQSYVHTTLGHVAGRPDGFIPRAPFRLLVFGDPQLEGDSSLIDLPQIPFWSFDRAWQAWMNLRKRLDLAGNDYYLAHIYRTMHWWTDPTHVTVLGDLLGSQWLTDSEFERRATRFWTRVFRGSRRVEDEIMADEAEQETGHSLSWKWRLINVVGNHDVGYAGDMISPRIARFEQHFGKVNWVTSFRFQERTTIGSDSTSAEVAPKLRIVILNSLNLDGPEIDPDLRRQTYDFVNSIITASHPVEDRAVATVLLTHLPLPKSAGVCPDDPYIAYNDEVYGGGIKEQNHLSDSSGRSILECVFGMSGNLNAPNGGLGRPGIILTGHDHRGCDVYHHLPHADAGQESSSRRWNATRWPVSTDIANDKTIPGIREVTLRSMMGEFGGHAGLLAAWYDHSERRWRFDYSSCSLGVQHIWWAVHVLDIMTLLSFVLFVSVSLKGFVPDLGRFYDSQSVLLKQDAKRSSSEKPLHKTSALEVNRLSQLQRRRAPT